MEGKTKNWYDYIFTAIIVVIFIIGIFKSCNKKSTLKVTTEDDLQITKKNNRVYTKNSVIQSSSPSEFIALETDDKEIQELKDLVKEYKSKLNNKSSVTTFKTITKYDTVYKRRYKRDTIKRYIYNRLTDSISNNWIYSKFGFDNDSVHYSLIFKNEYSIVVGEESQGWFKKKKPFVEIINKNPYSEVNKVKTYQVNLPTSTISLGPGVYYGIGSDFKPQLFIGVGLQYNIIKF